MEVNTLAMLLQKVMMLVLCTFPVRSCFKHFCFPQQNASNLQTLKQLFACGWIKLVYVKLEADLESSNSHQF